MKAWELAIYIILGLAIYELIIQGVETWERHHYWKVARMYCNRVNKQLLRVGMRRSFLEPPNGDITIDIDVEVLKIPGGVLGDERNMPFEDKQFGVCFNEHTLEHLYTQDDVDKATAECTRVADFAIFLTPSPYSIWATFFCKTHRLRIYPSDQQIEVEQIAPTSIGRSLVAYQKPAVYAIESNKLLRSTIQLLGGRPQAEYEKGYERYGGK